MPAPSLQDFTVRLSVTGDVHPDEIANRLRELLGAPRVLNIPLASGVVTLDAVFPNEEEGFE